MSTANPPTQQTPPTSQAAPASASSQPTASPSAAPAAGSSTSPESSQSNIQFPGMQTEQVLAILKGLGPNFYPAAAAAVSRPGEPKDSAAAAEALSNMSQTSYGHPSLPHYQHYQPVPGGSPNLPSAPQGDDVKNEGRGESPDGSQSGDNDKPKSASGRRNARSATMSSEDWARQRKDNHKEVERRRRGNINEGINELGRIVPNGSGEKAKGAILSRAVQYIHHLKENEARNIEKWTLEKLLMDQAMGDLQSQLDEVKRLWEEERAARVRVEAEFASFRESVKGQGEVQGSVEAAAKGKAGGSGGAPAGESEDTRPSPKRSLDEVAGSSPREEEEEEEEARVKRQRVE